MTDRINVTEMPMEQLADVVYDFVKEKSGTKEEREGANVILIMGGDGNNDSNYILVFKTDGTNFSNGKNYINSEDLGLINSHFFRVSWEEVLLEM